MRKDRVMISQESVHESTIPWQVRQAARKYGNREFFRFEDQAFTFKDLDGESDRVAAGLQSLGIKKGDKVALMMNNCPEFLFLWFGIAKLGAVEVPINTAHRGQLLTYMVTRADCRLLVVDSRFLDRVGPVLGDMPLIEKVIVLKKQSERLPSLSIPVLDYGKLANNSGKYDQVEILWSDPFAIMYTSGTTGPSKGSLMPQHYAIFLGHEICEAAEYSEADCLYTALPLFHGNAQLLSTMPALLSGARMVLAERFSASRFWSDIKLNGCTAFNYLGGVLPIIYSAALGPDDSDNPVRVMVGAGARMDIFEPFERRFGVKLVEIYGTSEIGLPLMNTLKERKPHSCGKVRPDYVVRLVDDSGIEVRPHSTGELLVRLVSPYSMFLEYYKMPEKTVDAWRDLWFHTGDHLWCDEEGYFFFVDRKKDALRRRGENISSQEVEAIINSHPTVMESAAVAVKSELGEDEVMICVSLKSGGVLTPLELVKFCEENMAYFMVPRYIRMMDALPKTQTEKIEKYKLREEGVTPDTWDREKEGYKLKR